MATTVDRALFSRSVRHQIDLHRYGSGVVSDIVSLLNEADKDMMMRLAKYMDQKSWTGARLQAVIDEFSQINAENYHNAFLQATRELKSFSLTEAGFAADLLSAHYAGSGIELDIISPAPQFLKALVTKEPITVGADGKLLLEEIFKGMANQKEALITQSLRLGMAEGESIGDLTTRLVGTRAAQYKDGVLQTSRNSAEAMIRTAVNSVSNKAIQTTYEENDSIVSGWIFLATLDSHTTITCARLSGTEWPVGAGPLPPRHVRCRSFSIPKLKTWRELGADIDEFPSSTRASHSGQVSADIKFGDWLKGEDSTTRHEILGATRKKLFDAGMTLDKFTDDAGRVYNLEGPGGLRERNKALFNKLNI